MVFTREDGDFHGRTVSFREGNPGGHWNPGRGPHPPSIPWKLRGHPYQSLGRGDFAPNTFDSSRFSSPFWDELKVETVAFFYSISWICLKCLGKKVVNTYSDQMLNTYSPELLVSGRVWSRVTARLFGRSFF